MLAPFMPCGAKLPVIALFAGVFFADASWVGTLMYFVGIALIFFGALLVGVAVVVLLLLAVPLFMFFRMRRMSRRVEEQMRDNANARGFYNQHTSAGGGQWSRSGAQEGRVSVHPTSEQPQKRVSDDVGDYVDFEEVKQPKK